jgi:hypothetical protein
MQAVMKRERVMVFRIVESFLGLGPVGAVRVGVLFGSVWIKTNAACACGHIEVVARRFWSPGRG